MATLRVRILLGAALITGCSVGGGSTVRAEGSDRYPSTTASDWVSYGDFVGVVTVAEERRAAAAQEALDRGEGSLGRSVNFTVEEVLWRRAPPELPAAIVYPALGWEFRDGNVENPSKVVSEDRPRFEPGHRYVVAFVHEPSRCY